METNSEDKSVNSVEKASRRKLPGGISVWKKVVFAAIIVCVFFILAEVVLSILGVRPVSYEKDPYVGFSSYAPLFTEQQSPDGGRYLVTSKNKLVWFNSQEFALNKETDAYRIFCVGGSTTYGRPYNDLTSFSGWLRAMLRTADPTRQWEVVNAGGISYASYRVAMLMEELIDYEPDLFIIYSGHNEFLENRTYDQMISMPKALRGIGAVTSKTRVYTAVKHVVDRLKSQTASKTKGAGGLSGEVDTILEKTVGTEAYHRDRALQEQIIEHYRYNLMRMIDIAQSIGAKVILVKPASKLRNCSPFKSQHRDGLIDADLENWQTFFDSANQAYAEGRWDDAKQAIDKALRIDDQYAELQYLYGRVLWQLEDFGEAKQAFIRARDEDICPLRALTTMQNIVQEVAVAKDVPLVDFVELAEKHSAHATTGEGVFLDHVHPTIEANRLLSLALMETMRNEQIVHPVQAWDDGAIQQVKERVESHLDINAHALALANLARLYAWCGKYEDGYRMALKAIEMSPVVPEAYLQAAVNAGNLDKTDESVEYYREYVRLKPDAVQTQDRLGRLLASKGQLDEAVYHYQLALQANPSNAETHNNLATVLQAQGKIEEAILHYRQALELDPSNAQAHNNYGTVLKALGNTEESAYHYDLAVKADPEFFEAHYNLALTYMAQGKFDEALEHFQQVRRIKGEWPDCLVCIAYILAVRPDAQKRDPKQAVALGERAVALDNEDNIRFLNILAIAYASNGNYEQAVATAQKALSLASAANADNVVKTISERLELYENGKPYLPYGTK